MLKNGFNMNSDTSKQFRIVFLLKCFQWPGCVLVLIVFCFICFKNKELAILHYAAVTFTYLADVTGGQPHFLKQWSDRLNAFIEDWSAEQLKSGSERKTTKMISKAGMSCNGKARCSLCKCAFPFTNQVIKGQCEISGFLRRDFDLKWSLLDHKYSVLHTFAMIAEHFSKSFSPKPQMLWG